MVDMKVNEVVMEDQVVVLVTVVEYRAAPAPLVKEIMVVAGLIVLV